MNGNENKKRWLHRLSYTLNILFIAALVLLIRQNILLRNALTPHTPIPPSISSLKPGEHVKPFRVKTLDGNDGVIDCSDTAKKYLLCVFSTSCSHCERTIPFWQMIANNRPQYWEVIGISLQGGEETKTFVADNKISFSTVTAANDTGFEREYKIPRIPATILIRGGGVVEQMWIGELTTKQTDEIQNFMNSSPSH
jgi:peroxiredoxin